MDSDECYTEHRAFIETLEFSEPGLFLRLRRLPQATL